MATLPLSAHPDTVLVDRRAGQQRGMTEITYTEGTFGIGRLILWERIVGKPWIPIDLAARAFRTVSGDPERDGVFSVTLRPGQVYQVVMYHRESADPNIFDPTTADQEQKPDASLTVVALLKDPEQMNLIVSQDQNVGGTFFRKVVTTTVPTSFVLQVSEKPPFTDAAGVERFLAPLGTAFDTSNLVHDREVEPLLPGDDLFFLMRVVDDLGNWQIVSDQFRTKQRTVTIKFDKLHIRNDGAAGDTTAEFRIWVMEGDSAVKSYFFGDIDSFPITDSPSPSHEDEECIPLADPGRSSFCASFILGPKDVTHATHDIGILTRGLCRRYAQANDYASNFGLGDRFPNPIAQVPSRAKFPFPTGRGETVQDVRFVVRTEYNIVDVEFEFDVRALFTVNYT